MTDQVFDLAVESMGPERTAAFVSAVGNLPGSVDFPARTGVDVITFQRLERSL